jgi:trehalose-6-phosphatase
VQKVLTRQKSLADEAKPRNVSVKCLSSDYDGTISPLNVSRAESRVPLETRVMLAQIGRFLPISIFTMKDLSFVMPRTPFAHAWSAMGGLEMRIGKRVLKRECLEQALSRVSLAFEYARSQTTESGVEVEEKQDSEGRTVAFCVDWRQTKDSKRAKQEVERIATYCKAVKLGVIRYEMQPFFDVYPVAPDKGRALQDMLSELALRNCGVLYLGDSKIDNPAFRVSSVSVGVIHSETSVETLDCDYLVEFDCVPDFLNALLASNFLFSSDFPMIKTNHPGMRRN